MDLRRKHAELLRVKFKKIDIAEHLGQFFGLEDSKSQISSYFQKICPFGAIGDQLLFKRRMAPKLEV